MKSANNKIAISLIALFLIATVVAVVPNTVNAQDRYYTSYVYVASGIGNRPLTLGDEILLVAWTADMPPNIGEIQGAVSSPSGRAGWYDMQVKIWDPDNETETLDFPYTDPVGAVWLLYTPTKVGTYQIQALFPYTEKEIQVTIQSGGSFYQAGDVWTYSAAESPIETFEVVEEATPKWVESPLVGAYWTRPLNDAAREWYVLAGNWLAGSQMRMYPPGSYGGNVGNYAYGDGPESAHLIWSKPFYIGGIMDERYGDINFATAHYQGNQFSPDMIVDGKIFWNPYKTHAGTSGLEIIDLYSGETLYFDYDSDLSPNMATNYLYESPNQHGGFLYLWETGGGGGFFFGGGGTPVEVPDVILVNSAKQAKAGDLPTRTAPAYEMNSSDATLGTVWKMIDAHTLQTMCYIANVSTSGTQVYGKDGSILRYRNYNLGTSDAPNYYCSVWNSSCGTMPASQSGTGSWQWRPAGGDFGAENPYFGSPGFFIPFEMNYNVVHDGSQFYWQNFSIPDVSGGSIQCIREGELMVVGQTGSNTPAGVTQGWEMGISLEEGNKGAQLWKTSYTPPFVDTSKNITVAGMFTGGFSLMGVYPEDDIMLFGESKQLKVWCYSLSTGQQLWETEDGEIPQYWFYSDSVAVINNMVLIYGGYAGTIIAKEPQTGETIWRYDAEGIGEESPYGNYPISFTAVSNDKLYTMSWEHSYTHPIVRGYTLKCINLTDGTEIWGGLDWGTGGAMADGILLSSNSLDNMIYAYGRGPSATTVTASPMVSVHGSNVMITGTVTDQTPTGRRNTNDLLDWTLKGTPAISDEDMGEWMAYMFMQQAKPMDAKGVEVVLETLDPNGNFYEIGRTTSDIEGNYGFAFAPEVPGAYQIFATFEGSASYGPSADITYITVDEAPQASPTPTPAPPYGETADATILPATIGIIVAIVVVGIVVILLLRRR